MRAVVQRVTHAQVDVLSANSKHTSGEIQQGLMVLLGVGNGDTDGDARKESHNHDDPASEAPFFLHAVEVLNAGPCLVSPCPFAPLEAEDHHHDEIDQGNQGQQSDPSLVEDSPYPGKPESTP